MSGSGWVIRGEIAFDGTPVDLAGAVVRIRLDDVSHVDARAVTVAEQPAATLSRGTTSASPIPFEVVAESPSGRAQYTLWAHVDVDRDGQISNGDFITMEAFPVRGDESAYHRVRVRRVE